MTSTALDDWRVRDYLAELERASAGLPPERRVELLADIREHVATAEDPDLARVLERLGDPRAIAAEAAADLPPTPYAAAAPAPRPRSKAVDVVGIGLLLVGGLLVPLLGWLVGLAIVLTSHRFRASDKLMAGLVLPFGWLPLVVLGLVPVGGTGSRVCYVDSAGGNSCSTDAGGPSPWLGIALAVVLAGLPVVTTVRLGRRLARVA